MGEGRGEDSRQSAPQSLLAGYVDEIGMYKCWFLRRSENDNLSEQEREIRASLALEDTRLKRKSYHYEQFSLSLGKPSRFLKINPLNTDTC